MQDGGPVKRSRFFCGGEALSRRLADQLLDWGAALWNLYGPTETTIWSTLTRVEAGDGPPLIGRPVANTEIYDSRCLLAASAGGSIRRALYRRRRFGARLLGPAGANRGEIRMQYVQRSTGSASLPHRGYGSVSARWKHRVSRPHRQSGQDPRPPNRVGRGRVGSQSTSGSERKLSRVLFISFHSKGKD